VVWVLCSCPTLLLLDPLNELGYALAHNGVQVLFRLFLHLGEIVASAVALLDPDVVRSYRYVDSTDSVCIEVVGVDFVTTYLLHYQVLVLGLEFFVRVKGERSVFQHSPQLNNNNVVLWLLAGTFCLQVHLH